MKFMERIGGAAAIGAAMLIGAGLSAPPAQAAYIVTLEQVGSNVVATGSGTIDLAGLSSLGTVSALAGLSPSIGVIRTGPFTGIVTIYRGVSGPTSFGSGSAFEGASSGSGDMVGIFGRANQLNVPFGYVSGSPLSDTSTYNSTTLSTLGVTPGTHVWTWGATLNDSFTLDIGVPEPSSLLLLALPLGFLLLLAARRRRAARTA